MFTGIIRELGTVAHIRRANGLVRLGIAAPKAAARVGPLESVAIDGVCLSVVHVEGALLTFELIPETQRLTTLGRLRSGRAVHVEPSLSVADRLNGHILFGHVDGRGTIVARRQRPGELRLEIRAPAAVQRFLVPKGPVAVDGVSLTVGSALGRSTFSVHLIPETLRHTTFGVRDVGDHVNVELDYLAKLAYQLLGRRLRAGT
jgi:riboflavin synthase alpha subunit